MFSQIECNISTKSLISITIEHKINEHLFCKLKSVEKIKEEKIQILFKKINLKLNLIYNTEEINNNIYTYYYVACNNSVLKQFLENKSKDSAFGNNFLNGEDGFLVINPDTHEVYIDPLNNNENIIEIDSSSVINLKIQTINNKNNMDITIEEKEQKYDYKSISCFFPEEMYDHLQDVIMYFPEGNIEEITDGYILTISTLIKITNSINIYIDNNSETIKKIVLFTEKKLKEEDIKKIGKFNLIYNNPKSYLSLIINGIPKELKINSSIYYNNTLYKINKIQIKIKMGNIITTLDLVEYNFTEIIIEKKENKKEEKKQFVYDWSDFFIIKNNNIFFIDDEKKQSYSPCIFYVSFLC